MLRVWYRRINCAVAKEDFFWATALVLLTVRRDEVDEVVSAPEGVIAIRTDTGSTDEVGNPVRPLETNPGVAPVPAVTGTLFRFCGFFCFLTAIFVAIASVSFERVRLRLLVEEGMS